MYQDKANRKRLTGRDKVGRGGTPIVAAAHPDLTEIDIQRAAAGIL